MVFCRFSDIARRSRKRGPFLFALLSGCVLNYVCQGNSIVGGVVSDCFAAEDRSLPMALFAVLIMSGQALGGTILHY